MKVLDLQCALGHRFEGWFGSQDDYDAQCAKGLLTCPVCGGSDITKLLSAPRLNLGHGAAPEGAPNANLTKTSDATPSAGNDPGHAVSAPTVLANLQQIQAAVMKMVQHVMANTEDVGPKFAEEARKIHYGESQERHIRGQATRAETDALIEEGIDVLPLPVPDHLKGTLQ
jgi:hypothetical protein